MQIVCLVLVLVAMASGMGNARDDSKSSAADVKSRTAHETTVPSDSDRDAVVDIRTFRVSQGLALDRVEPKPEKVSAKPKEGPAESNPNESGDSETADPPKAHESEHKVIYLTFDDGPTATYTKQVLDLLDEYGAKATFFELGENATDHPGLTRSVVARGHALGSHTWNHKDLRKLGPKRLKHQITKTSAALGKITGRPITCLRPPYGAVNARVKAAVRRKDLAMKLWDIDPRDWKRPGASVIARRVVSKAHPKAVSLMHDGGGNRSQSVRALKRVLQALSRKGYSFETLPGC